MTVLCAALLAAAGTAHAQGNVTIGGRLDLAAGKQVGSATKQLLDNAGSRLFFRGTEDLGGGLRAVFVLETRMDPSTGAASTPFWNGESVVGLQGGFGRVVLGRTYISAWQLAQNTIDPFGGDTMGAMRAVGLQIGSARIRVNDQIRYDFSGGGANIAFDIAESDPAIGPDRSVSFGANYTTGPLFLAFGYDNPGGANDKLVTVGARYAIGPVVLRAGLSDGTNNSNVDVRGTLIGATIAVGQAQVLMGYATQKIGSTATAKKAAIGYHYWLSKRTKLYADVARDSMRKVEKTGYDVGMQHNF
jgi:predicted porin